MVGSKSSSYLAKKLRNAQLLLSSKAKQTLHGVLTRTPRLIKTSFTASSSGKKKDQPTNVDPSPRPSTRLAGVAVGASSAASSSSNAGGATPFTPAPTRGRKKKSTIVRPDAHVVPHSLLSDDGDVFDDPYEVPHNGGGNQTSSNDLGSRRLLAEDLLNLHKGDEIALVIPIDRRGDSTMVKLKRTNLKDRIKQTIIKSCKHEFAGIYGKDKDVKFDELVKSKHTISREGHLFCEITLR